VKDVLGYMPRPPDYHPPKQGHGVDLCQTLGVQQLAGEQLAEARRQFKQRQVLAREIGWQRRAADEEHARNVAQDYRRQRAEQQILRDQARVENQAAEAERHVAARRQAQEQVNRRYQENLDSVGEREARRLANLTVNRINRTVQAAERQQEAQYIQAQRQANHEMKKVALHEASMARVSEQEQQAAAQFAQNQRTQASHVEHFRKKEVEAQKRKEIQVQVADQSRAILRSQIFF